ncbi:MAG: Mov34/MPN/PAD-1 family protein, partial [Actinomycetota bacterium]
HVSREEVVLSAKLRDEMIDHCLKGRPNEACGLLATNDGKVVKVLAMANAAASPVRYALDPKEQFEAYKMLDDDGLELGGVFHSHTRTEAYPSPTDVRMATEDVPYLIVSLAQEPAEVRAFRIVKQAWADPDGDILEVPVLVEG